MNKFEQITQSTETLVEFLAAEAKGENKGCVECASYEECTGKETCKKNWEEFLNSNA